MQEVQLRSMKVSSLIHVLALLLQQVGLTWIFHNQHGYEILCSGFSVYSGRKLGTKESLTKKIPTKNMVRKFMSRV